MSSSVHTDTRLLAILDGGRTILSEIDPEGILSAGRAVSYSFDRKSERHKALVSFTGGSVLSVSFSGQGGQRAISSIQLSESGARWEPIPCEPGKTVLASLPDLTGIPARLKRLLVSACPESAKTGVSRPVPLNDLVQLLTDAVLWSVEGAEKDQAREHFQQISAVFNYESDRAVKSVQIRARRFLEEGTVTVQALADIFGISDRKVTLLRNLGMGAAASVTCTVKAEGRDLPSLTVAMDLDKVIPVLYGKERKKKTGLGKPRAGK